MSAEVETMFYAGREVPWHGLGVQVENAPTSAEALKLAGLDWEVKQKEISLKGDDDSIPNYVANVRSTDDKVLGIVTKRYSIVQNKDAFEFTDNLIKGDVRYETAGSLYEGKKIWLLAKMPKTHLVGDDVEPYMCFTNTHDGSGAVTVCMTPIRVVCNNTLNIALSSAKRRWSVKHTGSISSKMYEAEECLGLAGRYMEELGTQAERLANKKVTDDEMKAILDELFPQNGDMSEREKTGMKKLRDGYMICYFAPDIAQYRNTAWGMINAMSDMVDHAEPLRKTKNYKANNFDRIVNGHYLLDKIVERVGV